MPHNLIKRKQAWMNFLRKFGRGDFSSENRSGFDANLDHAGAVACGCDSAQCSASGSIGTEAKGRSQAAAKGSIFRGEG